jgi:acyl phosphate:glycerol-3-phosphate acyltransferase
VTGVLVAVAFVAGAYLVGSLSPSVYLGRLLRGIDVREHGSGNAGAANAFRVLGTRLGMAVLAADVLKGFLPVLLVRLLLARYITDPSVTVLVAIAAMAGHNWSVFLKGRGGKGVATGAGVILAMMPVISVVLVAVFAITLVLTSTVSIASLTATALFPVLTIATARPLAYVIFSCLSTAVVFYGHRANIRRLVRHEEPRVRLPWAAR